MGDLLFKNESYKIVGICMNIHKTLGMGLKEASYKDAMEIDFIENDINFKREQRFIVMYKNRTLRNPYIADFIIDDSIIIEVKSVAFLNETHTAQALSYLAVSGMRLALLINFGERSLVCKRVVL